MDTPISRRGFGKTAVLGMSGAALAGCGSSSAAESKNLVMMTGDNTQTAALVNKQLAIFKKQTGISVDLQTVPNAATSGYVAKLRTEFVAGKGPDVFGIWGGAIAQPFVTAGFVAPLDSYYQKYGWDKTVSGSAGMTFNGKKYGLPTSELSLTAWYDKAHFAKAGVTIPTSFTELQAMNAKLKASGVVPVGAGGQEGWDVMRIFEYILESTVGPGLHDKLLAGKATWNQAGVVTAFQRLKDWNDRGWFPQGFLGLDPDNVEPTLAQGAFAYTISGPWMETAYLEKAGDASSFGTFALPTGHQPNRHSGYVQGSMISAKSAGKDNAAELVNFLAQPSVQEALQNTSSTVKGAAPNPKQFPLAAESVSIGSTQPFYTVQDQAFPPEVTDNFFQIQSQVIQGALTPAKAAAQMQTNVSQGLTSST